MPPPPPPPPPPPEEDPFDDPVEPDDAGASGDAGACSGVGSWRACTGTGPNGPCVGAQQCVLMQPSSTVWAPCTCTVSEVKLGAEPDCTQVECPAATPHLVGCRIAFSGSSRGCVARTSASARIYLKEGEKCNDGSIASATLYCSTQPVGNVVLDANTCPMNSSQKHYVASPGACP